MKIYFIGIGGIGVSALAQYYLEKGHEVSGSDLAVSEITDFLKNKGVKIFIGQKEKNITKDIDLVVYSPAVKKDNPELKQAHKLQVGAPSGYSKLQIKSYPEALGRLTKEYFTIAISGSHGKSTTTSMISLALIEAGLDPTVIVGTKLKEFNNSNFRAGKSKILVIEACEYDSSFLYYSPQIIVITNIDKEHLDYFKTFANVKKAFRDFIGQLPVDGYLVSNEDDKNCFQISNLGLNSNFKFKISNYSLKQEEAKKLKSILKVPGEHNVSNALAVLNVARILNIPDKITLKALSEFKGTWRRFEERQVQISNLKFQIISDYGHHPTEILATLKAVREKYSQKFIWCIFQPHQHQRTFYLFDDFIKVFRQAPVDKIIITDIYDVAGREVGKISKNISSEKLVEKINKKNVLYCACLPAGRRQFDNLEKMIKQEIKNNDVLLIMGAGNIYKLAEKL